MELILRKPRKFHASQDTVDEFEKAVLSDPRVRPAANRFVENASYLTYGTLNKCGIAGCLLLNPRLPRMLFGRNNRDFFAILMGLHLMKCIPHFIFPGRKSIYLFDAWPSNHQRIKRFVESWEIDRVFVSSMQAARELNLPAESGKYFWMPEAVAAEEYQYRSYESKDLDVIQFGRRYDDYHQKILPALEEAGKRYLYERYKGEIIFPSRQGFIEGLARCKISICVPCSMTNPTRAGHIETMTIRYLQSMASKCLILGQAPEEMIRLFGYNPVIEIDQKNPDKQVLEILNNFGDYVPLIEKNYEAVLEEHTWHKRWEKIAAIIMP